MENTKKIVRIALPVILCTGIIIFLILSIPSIEKRTWVLSYAQQAQSPCFVVAHGEDYNVSNIDDSMFEFSKPIELICEAKDGKLVLTDKTNGKTYEGTYTTSSLRKRNYKVVIDGLEGTANISSVANRTLIISIGGYLLNFDAE